MKKYLVMIKPVGEDFSSLDNAVKGVVNHDELIGTIYQTVFISEDFEQYVGSDVDAEEEMIFAQGEIDSMDVDTVFILGADDEEDVEGVEVLVMGL